MSRVLPPGFHLSFGLDRIVFAEPPFDLFPLGGQHDTLPLHHTSTFIVLGHYVQTIIEDLNETVILRPSELIGGRNHVVLLHLQLE